MQVTLGLVKTGIVYVLFLIIRMVKPSSCRLWDQVQDYNCVESSGRRGREPDLGDRTAVQGKSEASEPHRGRPQIRAKYLTAQNGFKSL